MEAAAQLLCKKKERVCEKRVFKTQTLVPGHCSVQVALVVLRDGTNVEAVPPLKCTLTFHSIIANGCTQHEPTLLIDMNVTEINIVRLHSHILLFLKQKNNKQNKN